MIEVTLLPSGLGGFCPLRDPMEPRSGTEPAPFAGMPSPAFIAAFDSAAAMVRSLGRFLHGKDFAGLGFLPAGLEPVAALVNLLPPRLREQLFIWSGRMEAMPPARLDQVRAEEISRWVADQYPMKRYPAVAIGSGSGALVHLCAALGIPWLPQTFLIPVARNGIHPDDPEAEMEWGREPGARLLRVNPDLQLHHMHDPNQDRLMVQRMSYFRVKRLRLGEVYEQFLRERLTPGGSILLSDCTLRWPTTRVSERHLFQHGALGGATPEEFYQGGPRVEEFLTRYGSDRRSWTPPKPDAERPEAEWGLEQALSDDVKRFASRNRRPVRRLVFDDPMNLSPAVADLYRWWYRRLGIEPERLLVESFILMEPWWALRTGSVPFWMTFNMQPCARRLEAYLKAAGPFREVDLTLFSHGVDSIGLAPISQWRGILDQAQERGRFIGTSPGKFPRDFGGLQRYHAELKRHIEPRFEMPQPLSLPELDQYQRRSGAALLTD